MKGMTRKITILLLMGLIAASGLFAGGLSIGASGALYMSEESFDSSSGDDIWAQFEEGEGVYYGVNFELLFNKVGLGLYTYFSFYEDYYYEFNSMTSNYDEWMYEMMDLDLSLGLSYHFFGTTFLLDPFIEGGVGLISKNIDTAWVDNGTGSVQVYGTTEEEEPIMIQGTEYWYAGAGLGINLGGLGAFVKVQYHQPMGAPEVEVSEDISYIPEEFPLNDLKVILGGKIIF